MEGTGGTRFGRRREGTENMPSGGLRGTESDTGEGVASVSLDRFCVRCARVLTEYEREGSVLVSTSGKTLDVRKGPDRGPKESKVETERERRATGETERKECVCGPYQERGPGKVNERVTDLGQRGLGTGRRT